MRFVFTFAFYLTSRWNDAAKVRFPPNSLFLLAAFFFPSGPRGKVDTLNCDLQWNQHVRAQISCQKAFPTCWLNRISSDDSPITSGLLVTSRFSAFPLIPLRGCRPRRPQSLLLFQHAPPWPATAAGFPVLGCSGHRRVWTLTPPCPPEALNHQSASRSPSVTGLGTEWIWSHCLTIPAVCLPGALAISSLSLHWIPFFSLCTRPCLLHGLTQDLVMQASLPPPSRETTLLGQTLESTGTQGSSQWFWQVFLPQIPS